MELRPSQIFYSQDTILNRFGDYTRHGKMCIGETLDDLLVGRCNVDDILTMRVMKRNGKWFTSDNRRLWVFRTAEEIGFLETVKVKVIRLIPNKKFTTVNHGQSVRVRRGGPGGKIWRNWKPQRPISNTVKSYQPSFYLNRSDASLGNSFTRRFNTIKDNVSYSYKQVKHSNSSQNCESLCPVSCHEEVTKPTRGEILLGGFDNKMQLVTEQLSQRQGKDLDKLSSDIKSTERADYVNSDDAQSYKPSVMSDRQTRFDQSCKNRNDHSWGNRNNADVDQISVRQIQH